MALQLENERFGRLVVKEKTEDRRGGQVVWLCRCECGGEARVTGYQLTRGKTKSCGCLRREKGIARGKASRKHGDASDGKVAAEYWVWNSMKARCATPSHSSYSDYGGRGITVCERWRNSYTAFLEDMGRRPSSQHSIERVDGNGDYTPENCRWATDKVQNRNTRRNNRIEIAGETKTLAEWLETATISRRTYYRRIAAGMTPEQVLGEAGHKGRRLIDHC